MKKDKWDLGEYVQEEMKRLEDEAVDHKRSALMWAIIFGLLAIASPFVWCEWTSENLFDLARCALDLKLISPDVFMLAFCEAVWLAGFGLIFTEYFQWKDYLKSFPE